jgi:hypothetical protein
MFATSKNLDLILKYLHRTRNMSRTRMHMCTTIYNMKEKQLHHEGEQLQHVKNIVATSVYNNCNIKKSPELEAHDRRGGRSSPRAPRRRRPGSSSATRTRDGAGAPLPVDLCRARPVAATVASLRPCPRTRRTGLDLFPAADPKARSKARRGRVERISSGEKGGVAPAAAMVVARSLSLVLLPA